MGQTENVSPALLELMLDNMPTLAWIADVKGYIFWYNLAWYSYTGTDLATMAGFGWISVHDPMVLPEVMMRWTACLKLEKPFEMVFPIRGKDGRYKKFLTRCSPHWIDGELMYWFGTNTEVSGLLNR